MTLLRRHSNPATAPNTVPAVQTPEAQHPPLLLLAAAASLSARRLRSFDNATSAAEFVSFWFPRGNCSTVTAFWALPAPPRDAQATEALVLIRHDSDAGLVYPFSFTNMEHALFALRAEVQRGLRLGDVSVYYAVRASFHVAPDDETVLTPPQAPAFERPAPVVRAIGPSILCKPPVPGEGIPHRALETMRLRRWTRHAAPFAGFGSPPAASSCLTVVAQRQTLST